MSLAESGKVETKLSSSLHYNDVDDALYGSVYHYMKLQPYVQPTLSLTSSSSMEIQLPPSVVYNLSHSLLQFDVLKDAVAGYINFFHQGFVPFVESVQLFAGNGKELCSVNDVGYISKLLLPCHTSLEKLLTNPISTPDANSLANVRQKHGVIYRSSASPILTEFNGARGIGGVAGRTSDVWSTPQTGISNYIGNSHVNEILAMRVSLPLADLLPGTIFAVNKDIAPGEVWRLVIRFSASQTWGFEATNLEYAESRQFSVSPTISNAWVQCAIVSDEVLASRIKEKHAEGVVVNMPQLWVERLSTNQTGHYLQNRKFNSSHGKSLVRAFYGVFNGANQGNGTTNFQNYNGASLLYTSIRTQLDQRFNQPGDLVRSDGDIWMYMAQRLSGSAIQSQNDYDQRAVFIDDWTPLATKDYSANLNKQQGLSLATEREIGFDINLVTASSTIVLVVQTQRPVRIGGAGGTMFL